MRFSPGDLVEFDVIGRFGTICCTVDRVISHNPTVYALYPLDPSQRPGNQAFYEIEDSRIRLHFPSVLGAAAISPASVTASNNSTNPLLDLYYKYPTITLPVVGTMPLGSFISPAPYKCECGTDSVGGSKHSSYCPKYNLV